MNRTRQPCTDGMENASREYTIQHVSDLIRLHRDEKGWEFLFLAANQDAIATASQMNIHANYAASADFSDKGIRGSSRAFSRKVSAEMESLHRPDGESSNPDLAKSMEEILREEDERD